MRNGKVLFDIRTGKILWGEPEDACCCQNACSPGCWSLYDSQIPGGGDGDANRYFTRWLYGPAESGVWFWPGVGGQVSTTTYLQQSRPFLISRSTGNPPFYRLGDIRIRINHPAVVCPDEFPIFPSIDFHLDSASEYADLFVPPESTRFGTDYIPLRLVFSSSNGVGGSNSQEILDYSFSPLTFGLVGRINNATMSWSVSFFMDYPAPIGSLFVGRVIGLLEMRGCGGTFDPPPPAFGAGFEMEFLFGEF